MAGNPTSVLDNVEPVCCLCSAERPILDFRQAFLHILPLPEFGFVSCGASHHWTLHQLHLSMTDAVQNIYESSKLAKYDFQPYWPEKKLRVCVTGAGGKLHGSVPLVAIVIPATVRCMLMLTLCRRLTEAILSFCNAPERGEHDLVSHAGPECTEPKHMSTCREVQAGRTQG